MSSHRLLAGLALAASILSRENVGAQQVDSARIKLFQSIEWQSPPGKAELGSIATVDIPDGCRFADAEGTKKFLEYTENPADGGEAGLLLCAPPKEGQPRWFVVFSYDRSGYVKDDERKTLDANAILKTLRESNEAGNDERKQHGWEPLTLDGWLRPPYYDSLTHNLTWATKVSSRSDGSSMNHSVRLLGRRGVMHVDLVADVDQAEAVVPQFDKAIATYEFVEGQRYAEWREGDAVAKYGLTALIAGGAGAAAVKLGLFAKLWKVILAVILALKKAIILLVAAIVGGIKKLFGRKKAEAPSEASPGGA